jgi:hypothetical protein
MGVFGALSNHVLWDDLWREIHRKCGVVAPTGGEVSPPAPPVYHAHVSITLQDARCTHVARCVVVDLFGIYQENIPRGWRCKADGTRS